MLRLALIFLVLGFYGQAWAGPCEDSFQKLLTAQEQVAHRAEVLNRYFPSMQEKQPKLYKVLSGRIANRWERDQRVEWNKLVEQIASCAKEKTCDLTFYSGPIQMRGKIINDQNSANIVISIFKVSDRGQTLSMGHVPKGMSVYFSSMMNVIFTGAIKQLEQTKSIKTLKFTAATVVNPSLRGMLYNLGFKIIDEPISAAMMKVSWNKEKTAKKSYGSWALEIPVQE